MGLHPAENRGYRELYAFARRLADHWSALASRLPASPASSALADGARTAERLIAELEPLTAAHGLHGHPAAQGLGASLGVGRSFVRDRFLERNQAVRYAVADAALVRALLGYLAAVSEAGGNADLADFSARWERELGSARRGRAVGRRGAGLGSGRRDRAGRRLADRPRGARHGLCRRHRRRVVRPPGREAVLTGPGPGR